MPIGILPYPPTSTITAFSSARSADGSRDALLTSTSFAVDDASTTQRARAIAPSRVHHAAEIHLMTKKEALQFLLGCRVLH